MDSFDQFNKNYQQKTNFTVSYNTYLLNNTNMLKMSGRHLPSRRWINTKIYIWNLISFYQQMYLRMLERPVCNIINLMHATILYLLAASLSWNAVFKMTNIQLELIIGIDMSQFAEKWMRGDISYIANEYGKANNKNTKNIWREGTLKVYYVSWCS